jgi:hypothetical protein
MNPPAPGTTLPPKPGETCVGWFCNPPEKRRPH